MSDTKARIMLTSRKLFNQHGVGNVTIRMIALELNMSSGNLNYHFKKREDILEALYFEMVEIFDARVKDLGNAPITLKTVKEDILTSLRRMVEYRFFWTDLYNLLKLNKAIKEHFDHVYKIRFMGYESLFKYLIEKDILKSFEFKKEPSLLIGKMIGFSNTWLYHSFIYNKTISNDYLELQADNLLSFLYPYLTDLGKKQYKMVAPKCFN